MNLGRLPKGLAARRAAWPFSGTQASVEIAERYDKNGRGTLGLPAFPGLAGLTKLRAIHKFPGKDWTVERLATEAAMSRATLARRFAATLDDTPMDYLYRLRMRVAATLLKEPDASILEVAERVGYASESAFSSAFHRRFNIWPGEYRDQ